MNKEPILETERLLLRPITLEDAEAVFSYEEYTKLDGSQTFKAKFYKMDLE